MVRDFAQDMNRALATAQAMISHKDDAIQRVRELHAAMTHVYDRVSCTQCGQEYPCKTIKALGGIH